MYIQQLFQQTLDENKSCNTKSLCLSEIVESELCNVTCAAQCPGYFKKEVQ